MNLISKKLLSEVPVGIQKTLGYDNGFELIFGYTEYDDYILLWT